MFSLSVQEWAIHAQAAAIGCRTGATNADTTLGKIVDGTIYLIGSAELLLHGDSSVDHWLRATIVKDQLLALIY